MIIDAHYHLEERLEPVDRLIEQMDRHRIARVALIPTMVDVFHAESRVVRGLLAFARYALMGRLQMAGLLVYRATVTRGGKLNILGRSYTIYAEPDNEAVGRVLERYPERFYGWIFVNPAAHNPIAVIEKYADQNGWIGVKTHPFWHRYPVRLLDDTARLCVEKGLPLLMHLGGDRERGDYRFLPDRHPKLKLLYAHAGVPFYREIWSYAQARPGISIDLSSPYLDEPLRRAAVQALGPERCLYGSDGPYGYPDETDNYDHGAILREVERLPITDAERQQILSENFRGLAER